MSRGVSERRAVPMASKCSIRIALWLIIEASGRDVASFKAAREGRILHRLSTSS